MKQIANTEWIGCPTHVIEKPDTTEWLHSVFAWSLRNKEYRKLSKDSFLMERASSCFTEKCPLVKETKIIIRTDFDQL